jgi:hypothetical protein
MEDRLERMALGWWARRWSVKRKMGRFEAVDRNGIRDGAHLEEEGM